MRMNMKTLTKGQQKVRSDLIYCFKYFPTENLLHLLENIERLRPGAYTSPDGGGCLFYLLSEAFAEDRRINCRTRLREFFTGGHDQYHYDLPEYQPAKHLVFLNDQQAYKTVPRLRYGSETQIDPDLLRGVLEEEIATRRHREQQRQAVQAGQADLAVVAV